MQGNQLDLILSKNWDILVILDACRYDYFKQLYSKYFHNTGLQKVISPASNTHEWAKKVLEPHEWKDVVYVSANPFINSKAPIHGLDVRKKFYKIYDAWLHDWDNELQTVLPNVLTERALEITEKYPDKKFIIHYLQPHAPYIRQRIVGYSFNFSRDKRKPLIPSQRIRNFLDKFLMYYTPRPLLKLYWKYQLWRGARVGGEIVAFAKLSLNEWREAYTDNLKLALASVVKLLRKNPNWETAIITADHGELLGERFWFGRKIGHPAYHRYPELIEVPWLEVRV